ncbi:hypothetical protein Tco_0854600 [Tanacetum coccineum]
MSFIVVSIVRGCDDSKWISVGFAVPYREQAAAYLSWGTASRSSKVICGGLIMQKIHGLSLFEGDDDNCLFTVLDLPTPANLASAHTPRLWSQPMAVFLARLGDNEELAVDANTEVSLIHDHQIQQYAKANVPEISL